MCERGFPGPMSAGSNKYCVAGGRSALLSWVLGASGIAALAWILARIDYPAFSNALAEANWFLVALVPAAILFEQWLRAWKWALLLAEQRRAPLARVFAAQMAGSLANFLVPVAGSPLARSWLVARSEGLPLASVLASVALDRIVDGAAFVALAIAVIVLVAVPESGAPLHTGLVAVALGSAALLAALVALLGAFRKALRPGGPGGGRLLKWIPARLRVRTHPILSEFADGAAWPSNHARASAILSLAFGVKAIAVTHLLWAGLALGVSLAIEQYMLLMVLLGFVVVLTRFVRIPGGFLFAAIFLLELFGVDRERALAMAIIVQVSALVSVGAAGALSLVWFGAELRALKTYYVSR